MQINQIGRLYRYSKKWWLRMVKTVDHQAVQTQVGEDGTPTYSYAFMVAISAGIAIIGLLLNSPAVIIGAMLVSPLMGPIVLSGVALSTLNVASARKSAAGLALGIVLALAMSMLIVYASPITDATPEILARTRPNLFDLLVAILSGLAGGYAVIRGRGGAIVGVAIATALMPPLTVVGYGVATTQWAIARGASLLFVTNMLAIGLSVAFVASWYGFGQRGLRRELAWQSALTLLILLPLGFPLALSLQSIAQETYTGRAARQVLVEMLKGKESDSRIVQLQPVFAKGAEPVIDVVMLTQAVQKDLAENAGRSLSALLGKSVHYHIDQIVVSDVRQSATPASAIANPIQAAVAPLPQAHFADLFRKSFPLETDFIDVDENARSIRLAPKPGPAADILSLYRLEQAMTARFPGWKITLIPPAQALPKLHYERGETALAGAETEKFHAIVWALHAWKAHALGVVGHASTRGQAGANRQRAAKRAHEIARHLKSAGFDVAESQGYPVAGQRSLERQAGYGPFRSVDIVLLDKRENGAEK